MKHKRYLKKSPLGYFHLYHEIDGKVESRQRFEDYKQAKQVLMNHRSVDILAESFVSQHYAQRIIDYSTQINYRNVDMILTLAS